MLVRVQGPGEVCVVLRCESTHFRQGYDTVDFTYTYSTTLYLLLPEIFAVYDPDGRCERRRSTRRRSWSLAQYGGDDR